MQDDKKNELSIFLKPSPHGQNLHRMCLIGSKMNLLCGLLGRVIPPEAVTENKVLYSARFLVVTENKVLYS